MTQLGSDRRSDVLSEDVTPRGGCQVLRRDSRQRRRDDRTRTCEVWVTTTDRLRPQHLLLLDDQERARADRYRRLEDRERSILGAALLRLVAARTLGGDDTPDPDAARAVRVVRTCGRCGGPHGKPSLGSEVHVSLSHAGAAVVVAVTELAPVGVDIEPASRAAQAHSAVGTACTPAEWAQVRDGRDALRYWTRKEAVAKATGEGLAAPLSAIGVSGPGQPAQLRQWRGRPTPPCSLVDLDRPAGHLGALAVLTPSPFSIVVREGDDLLADS
jgi:4'-phosphopantetheinyl transferase